MNNALTNIWVKKAAGYDEISARFVKEISAKLTKPIILAINKCIHESVFPNKLKKS